MLLSLGTLLLALQSPATTPPADSIPAGGAYLDADARVTVGLARERREVVDRSITAYQALARQRISVGLRALRRDRVLFRRETAARVHWRRDGRDTIEVLGARQVVPIALPEPAIPDDLLEDAPDLVFDPADDRLIDLFGGGDDDEIRNPLAEGSEADYRFRSGDTTRIRLPDGRLVRLIELQVIPRRPDPHLLRGSFWLDADTHDAVRAVFRLAAPMDLQRDLGEDDEDIPGLLKPMVAELRYVTIEYGLWEQRWWLPRLVALDVVASAGSLIDVPVVFEQTYSDYRVEGAPPGTVTLEPAPADSEEEWDERDDDDEVVLAVDSAALLHSEYLPPSIYAQGEALMSEGELRELAEVFGGEGSAPVPLGAPRVTWSYLRPSLVRYNRVEGLALGGRVDADFGAFTADAGAWLALAQRDASVEVGVWRERFSTRQRLAAYRRISAADPASRPLGLGNSLSALLLGRDDGEYYRALGVELTGAPVRARGLDYAWRLFAERQRAVEKSTDLSLPGLFDDADVFHENIAAAPADQLGGELALRVDRGLDPLGFRWGGELAVAAQTGTFDFARPSLSAHLGFPLPGRWVGAVGAAAGTSLGEVPVQSLWYLGGPATVRGYGGASREGGEAFWRGRAEVANQFPAARLVLFSDAGWAGERDRFSSEPTLLSAGVGASFLDGLIRLDLARALRGSSAWRLDLYLDGAL